LFGPSFELLIKLVYNEQLNIGPGLHRGTAKVAYTGKVFGLVLKKYLTSITGSFLRQGHIDYKGFTYHATTTLTETHPCQNNVVS
jgi:hypothetical protein